MGSITCATMLKFSVFGVYRIVMCNLCSLTSGKNFHSVVRNVLFLAKLLCLQDEAAEA